MFRCFCSFFFSRNSFFSCDFIAVVLFAPFPPARFWFVFSSVLLLVLRNHGHSFARQVLLLLPFAMVEFGDCSALVGSESSSACCAGPSSCSRSSLVSPPRLVHPPSYWLFPGFLTCNAHWTTLNVVYNIADLRKEDSEKFMLTDGYSGETTLDPVGPDSSSACCAGPSSC